MTTIIQFIQFFIMFTAVLAVITLSAHALEYVWNKATSLLPRLATLFA